MSILPLVCALALGARDPRPQDPLTHGSSTDGAWALDVDPAGWRDRRATYRMRKGSDTVWSGELPFTVFDAVVLRSGRVFGAALLEDRAPDRSHLAAVVLDGRGSVTILASRPIGGSGGTCLGEPMHPVLVGVRATAGESAVLFDLEDWGLGSLHGDWAFDARSLEALASAPDVGDGTRHVVTTERGNHAGRDVRVDREVPYVDGVPVLQVDVRTTNVSELERLTDLGLEGFDPILANTSVEIAVDAVDRIALWSPRLSQLEIRDARGVLEHVVCVPFTALTFDARLAATAMGWSLASSRGSASIEVGGAVAATTKLEANWTGIPVWPAENHIVEARLSEARILDATGVEVARLERGTDRRRLRSIRDVVRGRDRTWVVLDSSSLGGVSERRLHVCSEDGTPLATFELPAEYASSGGRVHVLDGVIGITLEAIGALVLDTERSCALLVEAEAATPRSRITFEVSGDGSALLVFESRSPIVRRYAMPRP